MTQTIKPNDLLPLTPAVFHILLALSGGARHGYAIMQQVAEDTQGGVKMGPGTLYGSISRMISAGLIEEAPAPAAPRDDPNEDSRRRYYRLTGLGRRIFDAELARLEQVVSLARRRGLGIDSGGR